MVHIARFIYKGLYTGFYMIKKLSCQLCKISASIALFGLFMAFLSCRLVGVYMTRRLQGVDFKGLILGCLIVLYLLLYLM